MERKEARESILYVHIKERNQKWLKDQMTKLGYKSKSEFVDRILDDHRNRKALDRSAR